MLSPTNWQAVMCESLSVRVSLASTSCSTLTLKDYKKKKKIFWNERVGHLGQCHLAPLVCKWLGMCQTQRQIDVAQILYCVLPDTTSRLILPVLPDWSSAEFSRLFFFPSAIHTSRNSQRAKKKERQRENYTNICTFEKWTCLLIWEVWCEIYHRLTFFIWLNLFTIKKNYLDI